MWLAYGYGRSPKMSATTPPPTESARLTAISENFCYYPPPPPLNLCQAYGDPGKFLLLPPPHRIWSASGDDGKLAPPQKKNPGYAVEYYMSENSHQ